MKLVLASQSITRKSILDSLNLKYRVITSDANECSKKENVNEYVEELSQIKANLVNRKLNEPGYIIIAADSVIYKDGKKYEKPKSIKEAINNLKELSGGKNQGITGVTLIDTTNNNTITFSCVTDVYFKEISDDDINWYIRHEKDILKKAGYSLEGIMSLFVDRLDGDYYNVLGLPLGMLYTKINELGYSLNDFEEEC